MVLSKDSCDTVSCPIHGGSYSGTGDLLASVVCAGMVCDNSAVEAARLAVHFLEGALIDTVKEKIPENDGLNFEPYLPMRLDK